MVRILVVEDDISFSELVSVFLSRKGFETTVAHSAAQGKLRLRQQQFDLLLLDYRLPDGDGFEVLEAAHIQQAELPVVIMTSFHDIRTAVKAIRSGAFDYITKPVNPEELLMVLQEALNRKERDTAAPADISGYIRGESAVSKQLYEHIALVAPTDMTVLLQGESGTGKEQAARMIHALSKRADKPFVAIDCGALSNDLAASELFGHVKGAFTGALQDRKGQFEAAKGGTLFLDEVGNLSYEVQMKLLRALQEREIQPVGSTRTVKVDVRIVAATNDDLNSSVKNGSFREDLYHRLNEFKMRLPTLKERGEDLELFINHFVHQAAKELDRQVRGISPEVLSLLRRYDWPGNLRELKNIVKRSVLLARDQWITVETLPEEMVQAMENPIQPREPDLKAHQAANEKELITRTLREVKYNKSKAARLLNIDRKTLYYKMSKYNIEG
jgi:two-component system response regulator HydG